VLKASEISKDLCKHSHFLPFFSSFSFSSESDLYFTATVLFETVAPLRPPYEIATTKAKAEVTNFLLSAAGNFISKK